MDEINKEFQSMNIKSTKGHFGRKLTFLFFAFLLVLFTPQIWLRIKYKDLVYEQVEGVPNQTFAVVFGAWVNEDRSLSDVTRERVEAVIRLYKSQKVKKLFLSGDNHRNQQAEVMANYAIRNGVNPNDIIVDKLGIDTNDTCKHFAKIGSLGILITQNYYLPRTMLMCETSKIKISGLSADRLGILSSRGIMFFKFIQYALGEYLEKQF